MHLALNPERENVNLNLTIPRPVLPSMPKHLLPLFSLLCLVSCQSSPALMPSSRPDPGLQASDFASTPDRYLCTVERSQDGSSRIKIMDLSNRSVRAVMIPGQVKSLDGSPQNQKLYASALQNGQMALFEVDITRLTVQRTMSFAQVGLSPDDFLIDQGKLYTVGTQNNKQTAVMSYDLATKGWQPLVYNVKPGMLEFSTTARTLQVLSFGVDEMTRTTIDVNSKQTVSVNYDIAYYKGESKDTLYGGAISRNGRTVFASVNNRINRFELNKDQIRALPPIEITYAQARHVALSRDNRSIYVSHDQPNRVSRIRFNPDGVTYAIEEIAFPGTNNELVVF